MVHVVGEMAIPFMSYTKQIHFTKYTDKCNKYLALCKQIIQKVRMRGLKMVLPTDINIGDEAIIQSSSGSSTVAAGAACDEGLEYDGETIIRKLADIHDNIVDGYVYDIGKESIQTLKESLLSSDFVMVWGTVGMCEYSSFQNGQRTVVDIASQIAYTDRPNVSYLDKNRPSQTVVIGNESNEWYSRIIDSDNDYNGDLTGNGIISYSLRQSSIFSGLIGRCSSDYIWKHSVRRLPLDHPDEWIYNGPIVEEEDDEED